MLYELHKKTTSGNEKKFTVIIGGYGENRDNPYYAKMTFNEDEFNNASSGL